MVYHAQQLDSTFGALADPTRREILARLTTGEQSISELASRFEMSLPAVSKHVYVLEKAGLASVERHGRARHVRLQPRPMRGALEWIDRYRRFWESELELLALYVEDHPHRTSSWPHEPLSPKQPPASRSAGRSARRASASSMRGRKRRT
jgi:DNA-binding transcriptional ArsR family regulator